MQDEESETSKSDLFPPESDTGTAYNQTNVDFCMSVHDAFHREVDTSNLSFIVPNLWNKFKTEETVFESHSTLQDYLFGGDTVNEARVKDLYAQACDMQILRLKTTRRIYSKQLNQYTAVEKARRQYWPSAIEASPMKSMRKKKAATLEKIESVILSLSESRSIFLESEPDFTGVDWAGPEHFSESVRELSQIQSELKNNAEIVGDVLKESRERARVNIAQFNLFLLLVGGAVGWLLKP